jgi:hypothetical protein
MEYKKEIVMVGYYNVLFYMTFRRGIDEMKKNILIGRVESGEQLRMRDIYNWCQMQQVQVRMKFMYRYDFSIMANLWNLYSYCRFRCEIRG